MHGGRPTRRPPTCRRATRGLPARFARMLLERLLPSSRSTASRLIKPMLFETLAPCEADLLEQHQEVAPVAGVGIEPTGPAYEAGLGASTRPAKQPL